MTPVLRWSSIIGAVVYGILGVLSLLPAALSAMMFDAPGSEDNPLTNALVAGLLAAPVVLLASALMLAGAGKRSGRRLTIGALCLPGVLVIYLGAVSIALQVFCGGNFVCR